jgi:hypothetical protein
MLTKRRNDVNLINLSDKMNPNIIVSFGLSQPCYKYDSISPLHIFTIKLTKFQIFKLNKKNFQNFHTKKT